MPQSWLVELGDANPMQRVTGISMHMMVAEPAVAWQIGMQMYHLSPVPSGLSGLMPMDAN